MVRRIRRAVILLLALAAVGSVVWLLVTGAQAMAAVRDLESAVADLELATTDADLAGVQQATAAAQDAAGRADDSLGGSLWGAVAAVPFVGDTPEAARITASALATAAEGLGPLLEASQTLEPGSLYVDGRIATERIEATREPLAQAAAAFEEAAAVISAAPTVSAGGWVLDSLDSQRAEAAARLSDASQALTAAAAAADVMPALLGSQGPRTWFVGIQSPAEARGTGGLPGNFVVLTADDGRLSLEQTGSNSDLETLPELPDLGQPYEARYGEDPRFFPNSNISPHFPYAGRLWRAFFANSLHGEADVVAGIDVVAMGSIIAAGGPITLPDGRRLDAADAVEFALSGVYAEYPDREERKAFQEAVASRVFTTLTSGDVAPQSLIAAVAEIISAGRLQLWSPVASEQQALLQTPTAGSIAGTPGPYAHPVVINATGSKLDVYLDRDMEYRVGRCPVDGRVRSSLSATLTNDIPPEATLDPYVVASAPQSPDGPVATTQFQVHLAPGAVIDTVTVDGEQVTPFTFTEQGRASAAVLVDLLPRQPVTVEVGFTEPFSTDEAVLAVQPLARDPGVRVVDLPCDGEPPMS